MFDDLAGNRNRMRAYGSRLTGLRRVVEVTTLVDDLEPPLFGMGMPASLRKNCDVTRFGAPVLAIEIVPTSFADHRRRASSPMLPAAIALDDRATIRQRVLACSRRWPPVPAKGDCGFAGGTAELAHEALDHAVERQAVVEARTPRGPSNSRS